MHEALLERSLQRNLKNKQEHRREKTCGSASAATPQTRTSQRVDVDGQGRGSVGDGVGRNEVLVVKVDEASLPSRVAVQGVVRRVGVRAAEELGSSAVGKVLADHEDQVVLSRNERRVEATESVGKAPSVAARKLDGSNSQLLDRVTDKGGAGRVCLEQVGVASSSHLVCDIRTQHQGEASEGRVGPRLECPVRRSRNICDRLGGLEPVSRLFSVRERRAKERQKSRDGEKEED